MDSHESVTTQKKNVITVYSIISEILQEKRNLAFGPMNNSQFNIAKILSNPFIREFQSYGLINELVLRNLQIKSDYLELRKTHNQIESIFLLSEKYHLCYDSVNTILFRKRRNKPVSFPSSNQPLTSL